MTDKLKIHIVVGGQYGSEGKGKVSSIFAEKLNATCVIRCGGTNSGHTMPNGDIVRQLPVSCIGDRLGYICAGSYIDLKVLNEEIDKYDPNLVIDGRAIIIEHGNEEDIKESIGSTNSGTGNGVLSRVGRRKALFAKDVPEIAKYIGTPKLSGDVIIEGTQGYGLSNIHGDWPYVTSRDTTASGFLSEAGLSPIDVENVIMVSRTFPIRVAGNSGKLFQEIDWECVSAIAGKFIEERTSVTKKIRRVGRWDEELYLSAKNCNKPTIEVLNHVDYICFTDHRLYGSFDYIGLNGSEIEHVK